MALSAGAAAVAVVVVVVLVLVFTGGKSSAPPGSAQAAALKDATSQHRFFAPECAPVQGIRWVYPGPTKVSSTQYESFAIDYSCQTAASWIKRLARDRIPFSKNGHQIPVHGPAGFSCAAWSDAKGHAYSGGCQKGKHVAFGWNWNVANPHDYFVQAPDGKITLEKGSGADVESILRTVDPGHYELDVQNTSGIGFINRFVWTPPSGVKVTAITKTTGATCDLVSGSKIVCTGIIEPPTCLCSGSGGAVTIAMATVSLVSPKKHTTSLGAVGAKFTLTNMTAVPFLIPGTPAEAAKQSGE